MSYHLVDVAGNLGAYEAGVAKMLTCVVIALDAMFPNQNTVEAPAGISLET